MGFKEFPRPLNILFGGNRKWQNHYLRNWAADTKGKEII